MIEDLNDLPLFSWSNNKKWEKGDIGPDGRIFYKYHWASGLPYWITKEKFLIKEQKRQKYYMARKHIHLQQCKDRYLKNKSPYYARAHARRMLAKESWDKLSKEEKKIVNVIYETSIRISNCIGIKFHVDHVIPLSKGGKHIPSNLQILPAIINLKKANKL
jgi:hypothetical protein